MPWAPSGAIGVLSHVPCSSIASASLYAVLFAKPCSLLLIVHAQERCIYRLIEINDGFRGPIATSETLFYCCDSLVLFLALAVFVPFWPGRFIRQKQGQERDNAMPLGSLKGEGSSV